MSLKLLGPLLNTHSFSTELSFEFDSLSEFEGPIEYNLEATNLKSQREGGRGRRKEIKTERKEERKEGKNEGKKNGIVSGWEKRGEESGKEESKKRCELLFVEIF